MKTSLLLLSIVLFALNAKCQELQYFTVESEEMLKIANSNSSKAYGDIIWEEDFSKEKWLSTVKVDSLGYLLDTSASLPQGWKFVDSTQNDFYWHWSDVGPRGVYVLGIDDDPFTPDTTVLGNLPEGTTVDNGFLLFESDYFNATPDGDVVDSVINMNSYIEFGPLDFSDNAGVMYSSKSISRYCCVDSDLTLALSNNYKPEKNVGDWVEISLWPNSSGCCFTSEIDRDFHTNISKYVAGSDSVFFRIIYQKASHYFTILDDIKFYEPPTHNLVVEEGWADYIYDAKEAEFLVDEHYEAFNFWGGYTQIPQNVVSNFVKFRAAVDNFATDDAVNSKLNVTIYHDSVLDYSIFSQPKVISKFAKDTLHVFTDYTPSEIGSYQVSMTVAQDAVDELPNDNGWGYEFKVTNGERYSRVRHGMEEKFGYAGPRDWVSGGNAGDVCAQRFTIPESAKNIKALGASVYIDDYTNRIDEIEAIKRGEFMMIARLYKQNENDSIVDTEIASAPYWLNISDTATWVDLNFVDEGNVYIEKGLYYAGIELFTDSVDSRFLIGNDDKGIKQPNMGGLVYFAAQNSWHKTGDNYAIDLLLSKIINYSLTFNADISNCTFFNPNQDTLFVEGTFGEKVEMSTDDNVNYTATINVVTGSYEYKYSTSSGFESTDFHIEVVDLDVVTQDNLCPDGVETEVLNEVEIIPNPFTASITLNNLLVGSTIKISTLLGQTILTENVKESSTILNTSALEKGVYLISIIDAHKNIKTKRIIKY